jgi:myo-inositol-1-phosphate synthase
VVDLIRIARGALDQQIGGYLPDACAFYFKSPPTPMDDLEALELIRKNWVASHVEVAEKI